MRETEATTVCISTAIELFLQAATLTVLFMTLLVAKGYAESTKKLAMDTMRLAEAAANQAEAPLLPFITVDPFPELRPGLEQMVADAGAEFPTLRIRNNGPGVANNLQCSVVAQGQPQRMTPIFMLLPGQGHDTHLPIHTLRNAEFNADYISLTGTKYQTTHHIENGKLSPLGPAFRRSQEQNTFRSHWGWGWPPEERD